MKSLYPMTFAWGTAVMAVGVLLFALCSPETTSATPPNSDSASSPTNRVVIQTNGVTVPTNTPSMQTNVVAQNTSEPKTTVSRGITGAELYSIHCNRCHPERYPTERTSAQWKTIMLHMQVRANLPPSQAKLILKYLQENSGR